MQHYLIDGYNCIFRLYHSFASLEDQRQALIDDLLATLDIKSANFTLVFDATYSANDFSRSHYQDLEIIYTERGQTADEYILDSLSYLPHLKTTCVVTSDKELARLVKSYGAKSKSVESFYKWMNKAIDVDPLRKSSLPPRKKEVKSLKENMQILKDRDLLPSVKKNTPSTELFHYYLKTFEKRFRSTSDD